jgi:AraC-like DNA-binding protein
MRSHVSVRHPRKIRTAANRHRGAGTDPTDTPEVAPAPSRRHDSCLRVARMDSIPLTRAGIIAPIVSFLGSFGAPVERLVAESGIPAWALTDPEALVPASSTARLLAHAARSQGIDDLGLLSGANACVETLGIFGRLIRRSLTVGGALEAVVRNFPAFSSNGRMWLAHRAEHVEFCHAFSKFQAADLGWQQANHYILMLVLGIVRLGAGPDWRPTKVDVQTGECAPLRDADPLAAARLAFAQPATAMTIPRALLDEPVRPPDADLEVPVDLRAWEASAPAQDFLGSVLQIVEMLSWEGYPDIHATAQLLGMSVRTLQRHLAAAGFTHESVVGRARFATAAALLEETDSKILDIALDLGYSDHAHFTRAFRRWAGCSPQEFRRRSGGVAQAPGR